MARPSLPTGVRPRISSNPASLIRAWSTDHFLTQHDDDLRQLHCTHSYAEPGTVGSKRAATFLHDQGWLRRDRLATICSTMMSPWCCTFAARARASRSSRTIAEEPTDTKRFFILEHSEASASLLLASVMWEDARASARPARALRHVIALTADGVVRATLSQPGRGARRDTARSPPATRPRTGVLEDEAPSSAHHTSGTTGPPKRGDPDGGEFR